MQLRPNLSHRSILCDKFEWIRRYGTAIIYVHSYDDLISSITNACGRIAASRHLDTYIPSKILRHFKFNLFSRSQII